MERQYIDPEVINSDLALVIFYFFNPKLFQTYPVSFPCCLLRDVWNLGVDPWLYATIA